MERDCGDEGPEDRHQCPDPGQSAGLGRRGRSRDPELALGGGAHRARRTVEVKAAGLEVGLENGVRVGHRSRCQHAAGDDELRVGRPGSELLG